MLRWLAGVAVLAGATAPAAVAAPARDRIVVPAAAPRAVTVGVSGDLLPHLPVVARAVAYGGGRPDFRPMLRRIRPWVRRNDLSLCHVETPLVPGTPSGYPRFSSPPELAHAIRWAGFDACSTASNHSVDRGAYGIATTRRALGRQGVRHTGSSSTERQRRKLLLLRAGGARIAFLAYTQHTNGLPLPHAWSVNLAGAGPIVRAARRARRAGADAVIVNLHWGTEYQHAPDPFQDALARALARSGAITAVVGQHAHVVQPIRRIDGMPVVFGEGNLLSNQTPACCAPGSQDGMLVQLRLRVASGRAGVTEIRYVPTWVRHPDYTVVRAAPGSASYRRTTGVAGRGPHLTPAGNRAAARR